MVSILDINIIELPYEKFISITSNTLMKKMSEEIDALMMFGTKSEQYKKLKKDREKFENECIKVVGDNDE